MLRPLEDPHEGERLPLVIQEQGSFAVGGTVVTAPGTFDPIAQGAFNPAGPDPRGQTLHGDHAYVFRRFSVYLIDQPRRGRAARGTAGTSHWWSCRPSGFTATRTSRCPT